MHKAQAAQSLKLRTIEAGGITKSQRKKARQPLRIRKGVTIRVRVRFVPKLLQSSTGSASTPARVPARMHPCTALLAQRKLAPQPLFRVRKAITIWLHACLGSHLHIMTIR